MDARTIISVFSTTCLSQLFGGDILFPIQISLDVIGKKQEVSGVTFFVYYCYAKFVWIYYHRSEK
jgi:hypothetical protein